MLKTLAFLFAVLVAALVFAGMAVFYVLEPALGGAGAAGATVLVFLTLGGLAAALLARSVKRRVNWAKERKDRVMETVNRVVRPGRG